jgi:hypothetical protein
MLGIMDDCIDWLGVGHGGGGARGVVWEVEWPRLLLLPFRGQI